MVKLTIYRLRDQYPAIIDAYRMQSTHSLVSSFIRNTIDTVVNAECTQESPNYATYTLSFQSTEDALAFQLKWQL